MLAFLVSTALSNQAAESTLTFDLGGGLNLELALIPKGTFVQGSPTGEAGRNIDESARTVTIRRDFYLGQFPVTRAQFARFVSETRFRTEAEVGNSGGFGFDGKGLVQNRSFNWRNPGFVQTDDHPVCLVTYNDAEAFANWLSRKTGRRFQLPTEAQWEYACRAGTTTAFYNGDDLKGADAIGWHKLNSGKGTRPVGQKTPNAWGLFDMSGNVHEWCRDWYAPYDGGSATDPQEMRSDRSDAARRVLRGGSWLREPKNGRSAARYRNTPASRNADNGFRIALLEMVPAAPAPATAPRAPAVLEEPPASPGFAPPPRQLPQAPPPETPPSGVVGFKLAPFGLLCPLVVLFLILFVFVLRRALRPRQRIQASRRSEPDQIEPPILDDEAVAPEPKAGEDGFWLSADTAKAGSIIYYSYVMNGRRITDEVRFEPGAEGQFIYTGGQPSDITVEDVEASDEEAGPREKERELEAPETQEESPPPFAGFPPAY